VGFIEFIEFIEFVEFMESMETRDRWRFVEIGGDTVQVQMASEGQKSKTKSQNDKSECRSQEIRRDWWKCSRDKGSLLGLLSS
jgi:hypothetical protein